MNITYTSTQLIPAIAQKIEHQEKVLELMRADLDKLKDVYELDKDCRRAQLRYRDKSAAVQHVINELRYLRGVKAALEKCQSDIVVMSEEEAVRLLVIKP